MRPEVVLWAAIVASAPNILSMGADYFAKQAQQAGRLRQAAQQAFSRYPPADRWTLPVINVQAPASLARLSLTVTEPTGVRRIDWPVRCSVPLPRGALRDPRRVRLLDADAHPVTLQVRPTCYWISRDGRRFDQSVKFLLLEFLVSLEPNQTRHYTLEYGTQVPPMPQARTQIDQTYEHTRLQNGPWTFHLAMHDERIFRAIEHRNRPINDGGLAASLHYSLSRIIGRPTDDQQVEELNRAPITEPSPQTFQARLRIAFISVVEDGPVQTTLCIRGEYIGRHLESPPADHPAEPTRIAFPITIYARFFRRTGYVQLYHTVVYTGVPVKHYWRRYGLTLPLPGTRRAALALLPADAPPFAPRSVAAPESLDSDLSSPLEARQVTAESVELGQAGKPRAAKLAGRIALTNGRHTIALAVRDAWENFPVALRADGQGLRVDLLGCKPDQFLDLRYPPLEQISRIYGMGNASAHGIQKTHELWLWLADGQSQPAEALQRLAGVDQPLLVRLEPAYIAATGALGHVAAYGEHPAFEALETKIRQYLEYPIFLRDHLKLYGFIDWADQPSAPRAHDGQISFPNRGGEGWNNGEKTLSAYWFHWWLTGQRRYFDYGAAYNRHLVDIDTFHAGPYAGMGTRHAQVHWASPSEARQSSFRGMMQYFWITADLVTLDSLQQTMQWMDRQIWTHGYVGTKGGPFLYPALLWYATTGDVRFGPLMVRPMIRMGLQMHRAGIRMPYNPYYRIVNPRSRHANVMWQEETPLPQALQGPEGYWSGYGWDDLAIEWVELTGDRQAAELLLRAAAAQELHGWQHLRSYHNPERFAAFAYLVAGSKPALQDLQRRHWHRLSLHLPALPPDGRYRAADFFKIGYTPSGRNAVLIDSAHPREIPYQLYALKVAAQRGQLDLDELARKSR